jgi:hypothetical protein
MLRKLSKLLLLGVVLSAPSDAQNLGPLQQGIATFYGGPQVELLFQLSLLHLLVHMYSSTRLLWHRDTRKYCYHCIELNSWTYFVMYPTHATRRHERVAELMWYKERGGGLGVEGIGGTTITTARHPSKKSGGGVNGGGGEERGGGVKKLA